jgi:DNA-binding transcriptional LysR family regulator
METAFLRTFVLVADTGSMAEAARRLDLTSTSVAQQLKTLEREFGTPLLGRSGRTVQLTPAGHQVLEGVRHLLRSLADLKDLATSGKAAKILRIGTIHTMLHSVLPDLLVRLIGAYPQLQVLIEQDTSMGLYEAVQRGDLDAAFCIHPQFEIPKTMGWRTLRKEPLVVLVPPRLADRDPHEVLRSEPLIRYGRSQWGGKQAERYLQAVGINPVQRFELISLTAIAMMVDRGLGVSIVPDADPPLPEGLRVVKLTLPEPFEERQAGLLWLRASANASLIKALLDSAPPDRVDLPNTGAAGW